MRVSKLLGFVILAIFVGVCLLLAPLSAGENPWNDDQYSDTLKIVETDLDPDDPDDPDNPDDPGQGDLLGSPIFFLNMLVNDPIITGGKGNPTPDTNLLGSK